MTLGTIFSVIVADDHPIVLRGVEALVNAETDFRVVAVCHNGREALEAVRQHNPDIAVLDISMPILSGLEVLRQIEAEGLRTKVLFLTATANDRKVLEAITKHAHGFLLKETASDALVDCMRAVAADRRWISPEVLQAAAGSEDQQLTTLKSNMRSLSLRERAVTKLISEGFSNKEIARKLGLTEGTVKLHVHKVFQKTGVKNRASLVAAALRFLPHPTE